MPIERRSTIQSVAWVRDMYRARQLDLDPPYQRRSVWNREYKQFFVDSILKNYPIPPIFISVEVQANGSSIYHVVDGKQRLLSVLEFLEDRFPVSKSSYSPPSHAGKYFSQLDSATQRSFYSYFLPVEFFTAITSEEVTEIFDRFNRNVQRLNDQELRHARYGGQFIKLMETLADEPLWQELEIFSQADVRRMKDVEYVSVLFILTMHGIQEGDALDNFYAEYDEEVPDGGRHLEQYGLVKSAITSLRELVKETRFRNRADLYSLWSAFCYLADRIGQVDFASTESQLRELAQSIDAVPELEYEQYADQDAVAYSQAVRAGTTKQPNRLRRRDILLKYIAFT